MIINLMCMFFLLVGIYFGIITYIAIRKREIFIILGIFVWSLVLEAIRLGDGSYTLGLNDVFWTSRDIIWTLIMIYMFDFMRTNFALPKKASSAKKKSYPSRKK